MRHLHEQRHGPLDHPVVRIAQWWLQGKHMCSRNQESGTHLQALAAALKPFAERHGGHGNIVSGSGDALVTLHVVVGSRKSEHDRLLSRHARELCTLSWSSFVQIHRIGVHIYYVQRAYARLHEASRGSLACTLQSFTVCSHSIVYLCQILRELGSPGPDALWVCDLPNNAGNMVHEWFQTAQSSKRI